MLKKYIPILNWITYYSKIDFKKDLLAGLIVAIMLIPQGMAYATLAGLPPVFGLYAASIPAIIYALFGTSRHLSVGPVALVSILVFTGVSELTHPGSNEYIPLIILLMLMTGFIQFILGVFRLGFLVNFISQAVMSAFISAAAIIIAFSQLDHLLGIHIEANNVFMIILEVLNRLSEVNWIVFIIGIISTLLLILFKRYFPRVPGPLIIVGISMIVVYLAGLQSLGVKIIGQVPQGLPTFSWPTINLDSVISLLPIALTISFIGFTESISIGKVISVKSNYQLNPNKELIGLGLANVIGSFFSSYPVTGSLSRTAVNYESGGRTQIASIVTAVTILLTLLLFTNLFYYLPQTILGAIVVVAVYSLIDFKEASYLFSIKTIDGWTWIVTFLATLFIGIEKGIIIGISFSLLVLIGRNAYPKLTELGYLEKENLYVNISRYPEVMTNPTLLIYRIDASLNFANMTFLKDQLAKKLNEHPQIKSIILDFSGVNSIDTVAITTLEAVLNTYENKQIDFHFVNIKGHVMDILDKANWQEKHADTVDCMTIPHAVDKIQKAKIG